jgi:hypothetical protein
MTDIQLIQIKLQIIYEKSYLMDLQEIATALSLLADEAWEKVAIDVQPSIRIDS